MKMTHRKLFFPDRNGNDPVPSNKLMNVFEIILQIDMYNVMIELSHE